MMRSIQSIALLTFKEGLRYRLVYGVLSLAGITMIFTILMSGLFMRDIQKVILDISLSSVSLIGLLVPFFLAINMLSRDLEQKTAYTILQQPVSRSQYILGKYLGLCLLSTLIISLLTGFTLATMEISKQIYPSHFFTAYNVFYVIVACLMSLVGILVLNGCVLLWCSATTSSLLATLLSLATYVIGQSTEDLVHFMSMDLPGVDISPLTQKTVQAAMYIFPNLAAFDFKFQAAYGMPLHLEEILFSLLYGVAYTSVMLSLTIFFFSKKDIT